MDASRYVVTTVLAVLAFASGFIPPVGTLRIHLSEDLAALVVLAAVALVLGELVSGARRRLELGRREAEAARVVVLEAVDKQQPRCSAQIPERAIEGGLALEARIAARGLRVTPPRNRPPDRTVRRRRHARQEAHRP